MIPELSPTMHRRATALLLAAFVALAQGCVSTDELYAEYDEQACRVNIERAPSGDTYVRELGTDRTMTWEPVIHFALEKHDLAAPETRKLDRDIAVLARYPELHVSVRGYADRTGTVEFNRALSVRRVASVASYLRSKGIDRSRLEEVALGEDLPLVDTVTEDKVPFNRRVELLLMDVNGNPVPFGIGAVEVDAVTKER